MGRWLCFTLRPMKDDDVSVTFQLPAWLLVEIDAVMGERQVRSPARKVARSEVLRELIMVGLKGKTRRTEGVIRGDEKGVDGLSRKSQ